MALTTSKQAPTLASKVHRYERGIVSAEQIDFPMNRDFQIRFMAGFLVLLTVAAITLAWINFRKESQFVAPYDGVWWIERDGNIVADRVDPGGPGAQAGIKTGDRLVAIDTRAVTTTGVLVSQLYHDGVWSKPAYTLQRGQYTFDASPILAPAERGTNTWLRIIALIYLAIGLYVLFRRWTAPGSMHFYLFCLVSFVFYAFKYTGKLNSFDWTIYWGNVAAWLLQPALFLHFALTFPEEHSFPAKTALAASGPVPPRDGLLAFHVSFQAHVSCERDAALADGPVGDGVFGGVLRGCGAGVLAQLPAS